MEKSTKRGKIPQSDWPLIMARYEAGETLASIARTYDCSPPAISYVVSRSRARHLGAASPPSATEPQLIKAAAAEAVANPDDRRDEIGSRQANGFSRGDAGGRDANPPGMAPRAASPLPPPPGPAGRANGDPRRTLHLSLGTPSPGNGGTPPGEPQPAERHNFASYSQPAQPQNAGERLAPPANPGTQHGPVAPDRGHDHIAGAGIAQAGSAAYHAPVRRTDGDGAHRKEGGGSFIDKELRARVDGDIAAFLAAFDAALVQDTLESRSSLREATDRLLRAGARTRIELERLEARLPLPPRDNGGRAEPGWRHR